MRLPGPEPVAEETPPRKSTRSSSTTAFWRILSSSAATPSGPFRPAWGCSPAEREALGTRPGARGDAGPAVALPASPRSHRTPGAASFLSPRSRRRASTVISRGQSLLGVSRDRSPYPVHRLGTLPRPSGACLTEVPSLRSTGSAEGRPSLFARFIATVNPIASFRPMSFGLLLSHATPGRGVK